MCFDLQNAWAWGQCPKEWKTGGWAPCVIMVIAVHSPTMVDGREFLPPFMVAQNESTFRDHQHGSNNHCLQTFNSMDMDGILSI
jgi:hypothetical protein